jgi:gamma-glutamylcyclotransferase (GGCT)/AIG2-like uncharacterized protein YtfP
MAHSRRHWWKEEASRFLAAALAHVNRSRRRDNPVDRCEDLSKALNATWNAHYSYRRRQNLLTDTELQNGHSDAQAFTQLLLTGLDDELKNQLCDSATLKDLAEFSPHVMNHHTLLRLDYDPGAVTEEQRREASAEHRKLLKAYREYGGGQREPAARDAMLKKLATLLYVVRSNIAHSVKTSRGPDLSKNERDRVVSDVTSPVVEDFFDVLFDRPSERLAVYGTLAPGGPNAALLSAVSGTWTEVVARGELSGQPGLPSFRWKTDGKEVRVQLLTSTGLPGCYPELDKFEGQDYSRSLVPVTRGAEVVVANIYEGTDEVG